MHSQYRSTLSPLRLPVHLHTPATNYDARLTLIIRFGRAAISTKRRANPVQERRCEASLSPNDECGGRRTAGSRKWTRTKNALRDFLKGTIFPDPWLSRGAIRLATNAKDPNRDAVESTFRCGFRESATMAQYVVNFARFALISSQDTLLVSQIRMPSS